MYFLRMVPNRQRLVVTAPFVKLTDAFATHFVVDIV